MAQTVEVAFAEWKSRLEITNRQESLVSQRRANVTSALQAKLLLDPAMSPQVIGSWDHNTLIAPLSQADVDLLVVLDKQEYKRWRTAEGTIQALDRIKAILDEAYPKTQNCCDRNCITMQFLSFALMLCQLFISPVIYNW